MKEVNLLDTLAGDTIVDTLVIMSESELSDKLEETGGIRPLRFESSLRANCPIYIKCLVYRRRDSNQKLIEIPFGGLYDREGKELKLLLVEKDPYYTPRPYTPRPGGAYC